MPEEPPFEGDRTHTWPAVSSRDGVAPPLPPRWRFVRLLGTGGQADVWLAEEHQLGELVALKVVRWYLSDKAR